MVSKLTKITGLSLILLLALIVAPLPGSAQEYGAESAQTEIQEKELASFAKIQNEIARIQQEYKTRLSTIEDQDQRQSVIQEMNEELVATVKDQGLSVERYNEIFGAIQNNPELQERVSQMTEN